MSNHWSREDLPDGSEVISLWLTEESRGEAANAVLNAIVAHLNDHHPKPDASRIRNLEWEVAEHSNGARRAVNERAVMRSERDAAVARAEKAESLAEVAKATAHTHLETLVLTVAKRDAAVKRAEAAGRELAAANDELGRLQDSIGEWSTGAVRQQMQAWDRIADHQFFAGCYLADGALIDAMVEALDEVTFVSPDVDPVEVKAAELHDAAWPDVDARDRDRDVWETCLRLARHQLGDQS